jgi:hypothetical protein
MLPGILAAVAAAGMAACVADASVGYRATVVAPPPPSVYVSANVDAGYNAGPPVETAYVEPAAYVSVAPDVEVIEGYPEPVFINAGLYYRFEGGVWYSSSYHDRGWGEVTVVPEHIRTIDRTAYINYHGNVNARVGEVGYVNVHPTYPVHNSPPPRYVERPPATRGGQPVRYNPPPSHGPINHDPGRTNNTGYNNNPGEVGHGPVNHDPVREPGYNNGGVHETGVSQQHPTEPAHETGYQNNGGVHETGVSQQHPTEGYQNNGGVHETGVSQQKPGNEGGHGYTPAAQPKQQPKPQPKASPKPYEKPKK